jgi:hypothetical protein
MGTAFSNDGLAASSPRTALHDDGPASSILASFGVGILLPAMAVGAAIE